MRSFKNLTGKQLETMLINTKAEMKRRENMEAALAEIKNVLKKHKLTIQDIDLHAFSKKDRKKPQANSPKSRRVVQAKYANPTGTDKWSGRGRAPVWVNHICQEEGISLEDFKKDSRFTVK